MKKLRSILGAICCFAALLATLGVTRNAGGSAIPSFSLPSLVEQSDLIVMAQIGDLRKIGNVNVPIGETLLNAELMEADLEVSQTVKGNIAGQSPLKIVFTIPISPGGSVGYVALSSNQNRLLFLKHGAASEYELTSPYYPSLPAAREAVTQNGGIEEQIVAIECATIASPRTVVSERTEAIRSLTGRNDPCVANALLVASRTEDQELRLTASTALLQRNDVRVLHDTIQEILRLPQMAYLRLNALSAIRDGIKDQTAIPDVVRMMQNSDPIVRRAGASALRNIGARQGVRRLIDALNDSDKDTRYYAVVGLAEIENQPDEKPGMEEFDTNEERYIRYWKAWAKGTAQ